MQLGAERLCVARKECPSWSILTQALQLVAFCGWLADSVCQDLVDHGQICPYVGVWYRLIQVPWGAGEAKAFRTCTERMLRLCLWKIKCSKLGGRLLLH
jgi:hypothetical protein